MKTALFAFALGYGEILVILLILLLVFGAKRIPELARSLGRASREFKDAKDGVISELEKEPGPSKENAQDPGKEDKAAPPEKKG
ncbi:MAG: twin-arginine translocase TatA/TatE family subunit [Lentisphaeria bacterium]|nr:twin-arginine translocase TatA/TatE family subunit [Lentisphaeria bacterium]